MKKYLFSAISIITIAFVIGFCINNSQVTNASTSLGSSYKSIQTAPVQTNTSFYQSAIIQTFPGTLGSVVVTGTNTGYLTLYDATTSNVNLRAGATTTLRVITTLPSNMATSTYTYDADFYYGLVSEWTGNVATTTITYR